MRLYICVLVKFVCEIKRFLLTEKVQPWAQKYQTVACYLLRMTAISCVCVLDSMKMLPHNMMANCVAKGGGRRWQCRLKAKTYYDVSGYYISIYTYTYSNRQFCVLSLFINAIWK